jgi:hypothetical protein
LIKRIHYNPLKEPYLSIGKKKSGSASYRPDKHKTSHLERVPFPFLGGLAYVSRA